MPAKYISMPGVTPPRRPLPKLPRDLPLSSKALETKVIQSMKLCSTVHSATEAREIIDGLFDSYPGNIHDVLCILIRELSVNLLAREAIATPTRLNDRKPSALFNMSFDGSNEDEDATNDDNDEEGKFLQKSREAIRKTHLKHSSAQTQRNPSRLGTLSLPSAKEVGLNDESIKKYFSHENECDDDEENRDEVAAAGWTDTHQGLSTHRDLFESLATAAATAVITQNRDSLNKYKVEIGSGSSDSSPSDSDSQFIGIHDLPDNFGFRDDSGDKDSDHTSVSDDIDEYFDGKLLSFGGDVDEHWSRRSTAATAAATQDSTGDHLLPSAHPATSLPTRLTNNSLLNRQLITALMKTVDQYTSPAKLPRRTPTAGQLGRSDAGRKHGQSFKESGKPRIKRSSSAGLSRAGRASWVSKLSVWPPSPRMPSRRRASDLASRPHVTLFDRCGLPKLPKWGKGVCWASPPSPRSAAETMRPKDGRGLPKRERSRRSIMDSILRQRAPSSKLFP